MALIHHYRCDNPDILAVFHAVEVKRKKLFAEAGAVAKQITEITGIKCKGACSKTLHEYRFEGVAFEEFTAELATEFRKPVKRLGNVTKPKVAAREELKRLFQSCKAVDRDVCWKALGTSWDEVLFHGLTYVYDKKRNRLYVQTSIDLTETLTGIFDGEYEKAKREIEKNVKA